MGATHEDALQAALDKFDFTLTLKEKTKDCRVNTASGLQHSVEDVKVGKFDLIFAQPEALFNTMEEEALLFDKGFQRLITALVVI